MNLELHGSKKGFVMAAERLPILRNVNLKIDRHEEDA